MSTDPWAGLSRACAGRCIAAIVATAMLGCNHNDPLPVVARGRYVEIATDREEPVCGGTASFMDAYVTAVADLLGESLPDRVFVRYEWTAGDYGITSRAGDLQLVQAGTIPSEHELFHAVQQEVWPPTRPFMHEGLAVLLDNRGYSRWKWPEGNPVDPVLEAERAADFDYYEAWYLVSQIVRDHGFEGLKSFWHAVPADASAAEIRTTYEGLFGRPFDTLFEPFEILYPGEPYEQVIERAPCHFALCVGEAATWNGDVAQAPGPSACADDPAAVGPTTGRYLGTVWRPHVFELEDVEHIFTTAEGTGAMIVACGLTCTHEFDAASGQIDMHSDLRTNFAEYWPMPLRFEVGRMPEDLPSDDPFGLTVERTGP